MGLVGLAVTDTVLHRVFRTIIKKLLNRDPHVAIRVENVDHKIRITIECTELFARELLGMDAPYWNKT